MIALPSDSRWTVLVEEIDGGRKRVRVQCACGTERVLDACDVAKGRSKSCGCNRKTATSTHGKSGTPTYRSWRAMLNRCTNPNFIGYAQYGGRGITVCDRWREFAAFLADMGERPEGMTLDRIDVDGPYRPDNCRWATISQQNANKRRATECPNGHPYVDGSYQLRVDPKSGNAVRKCLTCKRAADRRNRQAVTA